MASTLALTPRFPTRMGAALTLTTAADFLLFDQPLGLSLLLFAALLAAGIAASNTVSGRVSIWKYLHVPIGLAPLFETISGLSVSIAILSLIAFALAVSGQLGVSLAGFARRAVGFALSVPFRLPMDFLRSRLSGKRMGRSVIGFSGLAKWLMPIILALVFIALFGIAKWGGAALPEGMTYASYAHRGAYPLIVTALLAAGFVLAAMRPGSETSLDPFVRKLVYLWTLQNVVLVLSSILRLDLYVGIYALTYWRVAAFIWMGLVAAGLVLIMARIHLRQPNTWLIGANLLTLCLTLYACSFVNFADIIAGYNITHSREIAGEGEALDVDYLVGLGPAAIPAIDRYVAGAVFMSCEDTVISMRVSRELLADEHTAYFAEWRAWTFRGWRLFRYLGGNPLLPVRPCPQVN